METFITVGKDGKKYYFEDGIRISDSDGKILEENQKKSAKLWEIVKNGDKVREIKNDLS